MNTYTYDEIAIGQKESFEVTVTEEMLSSFRMITGDDNPLHKDASYAKEKGYTDRVAYGMLTASFLSTLAGVYLPGERSLIQEVSLKFSSPVYPNDVLTIEGEVEEKNDTYQLIFVKVLIRNQDKKKVLKAKMQIGVANE